jgi:hypothetical protein
MEKNVKGKISLDQIVGKDHRVLLASSSIYSDSHKQLYITVDVDIDPADDTTIMETVTYEVFDYNYIIEPYLFSNLIDAIEQYNKL